MRLIASLSIAILTCLPAVADPALAFTGFSPSGTSVTSTRGYAFNVTMANLMATQLGFFDNGANGLNEAHDVGLWDPAGNLIASATVSAGTLNALDANGLFRLVDIVDLALPIGNGYVVGAVFLSGSQDNQAFNISGVTTATGIQHVEGRFINNGIASLTRPTSSISGFPGGSLEVSAISGVPEPGTTTALVGAGLVLLAARFRRRRG